MKIKSFSTEQFAGIRTDKPITFADGMNVVLGNNEAGKSTMISAQENLNLLVQAGRYTATAKNNQNCCFVVVQDELEELKYRIWSFIDNIEKRESGQPAQELMPYIAFNRRRKIDPSDDFLFRDAPAVLFITSDWPLDAGLAAQNIETMAVSLEMGVLYNGYLVRIAEKDEELKKWLGIEKETIKACMLLGYSAKCYLRTAPRRNPRVVWK